MMAKPFTLLVLIFQLDVSNISAQQLTKPVIGYLNPHKFIEASPAVDFNRCFYSDSNSNGQLTNTFYDSNGHRIGRWWTIPTNRVVLVRDKDTFVINIDGMERRLHCELDSSMKMYTLIYRARSAQYIVTLRPKNKITRGIIEEAAFDFLDVERNSDHQKTSCRVADPNCW